MITFCRAYSHKEYNRKQTCPEIHFAVSSIFSFAADSSIVISILVLQDTEVALFISAMNYPKKSSRGQTMEGEFHKKVSLASSKGTVFSML